MNGPPDSNGVSSNRPESMSSPAEKVRTFPTEPGVYLMKDEAGRVIYVGKAANLRSRAGSYFQKQAADDPRISPWIHEVADVDYVICQSEVDALLMEARLIKDIQPKYNKELKDDKTFPYLMITTREDFPRVEITREPKTSGVKLYGPFPNVRALRGALQVLQRIFQFRTCSLDIDENDERWKWYRPCLLASIGQCTAPCNLRISKADYRRDIRRLQMVLEGKTRPLMKQLAKEMHEAAAALEFERAAKLRDEIELLEKLGDRGDLETHVQPEVFFIDPKKGLAGLKRVLRLDEVPRTVEGIDIAHLQGGQTVASVVQFLDGLPFKPGYRRYKIRSVDQPDDYQSIREVVSRRYGQMFRKGQKLPDIILIDGGKGQLNAAVESMAAQRVPEPVILSLAKREELIFRPGEREPIRLSRHAYALRLLQYVRDEAHRFAQHYHHILRRKSTLPEE